jgi:hypothetical protein
MAAAGKGNLCMAKLNRFAGVSAIANFVELCSINGGTGVAPVKSGVPPDFVGFFGWNFTMRFVISFLVIQLLDRLRHENVLFSPRKQNGRSNESEHDRPCAGENFPSQILDFDLAGVLRTEMF